MTKVTGSEEGSASLARPAMAGVRLTFPSARHLGVFE